MTTLSLEERRHLEAAEGWLGLQNHLEANEELEQITPQNRAHPEVLAMRWRVYAQARKWDAALEVAAALIRLVSDHPLGWVLRSSSLHGLKRTAEARDNLLRVVERFPQDHVIRYNLACYECQLGRLPQAKDWLQKAFRVGDSKKIKLVALDDADLEPLWREIGNI